MAWTYQLYLRDVGFENYWIGIVHAGLNLIVGVTTLFAYLQLRHQRVLLQIQGQIASVLFGLIHGVGKLRTSGAEKRAYALWAEHFTTQRQRTFQAQRLANEGERVVLCAAHRKYEAGTKGSYPSGHITAIIGESEGGPLATNPPHGEPADGPAGSAQLLARRVDVRGRRRRLERGGSGARRP